MPYFKLYIKLSDELPFESVEEAREAAKDWAQEIAEHQVCDVEEAYASEVLD